MNHASRSLVRALPLSASLQEKLLFYARVGYWPDFRNPRTLNEKINWRKLYSDDESFVRCSDKLAVRDYVEEKVGRRYLIPVLYAGESITEEQILALGDKIVVKTTHDCGSVYVIRENGAEIAKRVSQQVRKSLKIDFGRLTNQWWYSKIPRRVYVEKLLEEPDGSLPRDFKFSLFRGETPDSPNGVIKVDFDRGEVRKRAYYTLGREVLRGVHRNESPQPFPEVDNYDEMLSTAIALAREFDYVRVDLYNVAGRIYFGELTFSHSGGRSRFTREASLEMGSWWHRDQTHHAC